MICACSNNGEVAIVPEFENELALPDESGTVRQLTVEMSTIALRHSDAQCSTRSWKKFWRRLATLVYNDACGYAWGIEKTWI